MERFALPLTTCLLAALPAVVILDGCADPVDSHVPGEESPTEPGCENRPEPLVHLCLPDLPPDVPVTGRFTSGAYVPSVFTSSAGVEYPVWHLGSDIEGEPYRFLWWPEVTLIQQGECYVNDETDPVHHNVLAVSRAEPPGELLLMTGVIGTTGLAGWEVALGERCEARGPGSCFEYVHNWEILATGPGDSFSVFQGQSVESEGYRFQVNRAEEERGEMTCLSVDGWDLDYNWIVEPA